MMAVELAHPATYLCAYSMYFRKPNNDSKAASQTTERRAHLPHYRLGCLLNTCDPCHPASQPASLTMFPFVSHPSHRFNITPIQVTTPVALTYVSNNPFTFDPFRTFAPDS